MNFEIKTSRNFFKNIRKNFLNANSVVAIENVILTSTTVNNNKNSKIKGIQVTIFTELNQRKNMQELRISAARIIYVKVLVTQQDTNYINIF